SLLAWRRVGSDTPLLRAPSGLRPAALSRQNVKSARTCRSSALKHSRRWRSRSSRSRRSWSLTRSPNLRGARSLFAPPHTAWSLVHHREDEADVERSEGDAEERPVQQRPSVAASELRRQLVGVVGAP